MKTKIVLLALLVLASFCHAQEELPTIVPDRPGITFGTEVMPLHKLGWDNGFCYEHMPDGSPSITLNSTIFRYGIFENVELRLGTDFLLFNDLSPAIGIAPLTFGVKTSLFEGTEILPSVGVLAELQSPHIGTKELLAAHLAPSLYLLFATTSGKNGTETPLSPLPCLASYSDMASLMKWEFTAISTITSILKATNT